MLFEVKPHPLSLFIPIIINIDLMARKRYHSEAIERDSERETELRGCVHELCPPERFAGSMVSTNC